MLRMFGCWLLRVHPFACVGMFRMLRMFGCRLLRVHPFACVGMFRMLLGGRLPGVFLGRRSFGHSGDSSSLVGGCFFRAFRGMPGMLRHMRGRRLLLGRRLPSIHFRNMLEMLRRMLCPRLGMRKFGMFGCRLLLRGWFPGVRFRGMLEMLRRMLLIFGCRLLLGGRLPGVLLWWSGIGHSGFGGSLVSFGRCRFFTFRGMREMLWERFLGRRFCGVRFRGMLELLRRLLGCGILL
jgi:hypothetical protein